MVSRSFLAVLVYSLPILIVTFSVLMGAESIAQAAKDYTAALVLWWIALGCLLVTIIDLLLLVVTLGIEALTRHDHDRNVDES